MAKAIMIQGAGSNVGKSVIVAGICAALRARGFRVAPFKPQNMSNNAAVTVDGGEIGRAQALQARACGRDPVVDMNPVLLKPESDTGAQVVVQGKRLTTVKARDYAKLKPTLLPQVLNSFHRLAQDVDFVIVEGAGSPAEVNLRPGDIANMGFAEAANTPVVLFGDIDRGGVIAQLVGTHAVLPPGDRGRIVGFGINKFRGDPTLFDDGLTTIAQATGWASLGVLPWFPDAWKLPAEDVMDISTRPGGQLKIAVPRLNRIANFDDLDPLVAQPEVSVDIITEGQPLPGDADLVLIPGSKSTIADLIHFRAQGWDIDLHAHIRRGGHVLGVCGGYQMLGKHIHDPDGIEGDIKTIKGLGHLDVSTTMSAKKNLKLTHGHMVGHGCEISGYEIHIGETTGPDCDNAWIDLGHAPHGAASANGRIKGCYLHGLFSSDAFRRAFLGQVSQTALSPLNYEQQVDDTLAKLATFMEQKFDIDGLIALASPVQPT